MFADRRECGGNVFANLFKVVIAAFNEASSIWLINIRIGTRPPDVVRTKIVSVSPVSEVSTRSCVTRVTARATCFSCTHVTSEVLSRRTRWPISNNTSRLNTGDEPGEKCIVKPLRAR
jgi:hypothetical protein